MYKMDESGSWWLVQAKQSLTCRILSFVIGCFHWTVNPEISTQESTFNFLITGSDSFQCRSGSSQDLLKKANMRQTPTPTSLKGQSEDLQQDHLCQIRYCYLAQWRGWGNNKEKGRKKGAGTDEVGQRTYLSNNSETWGGNHRREGS